MTLASAGSCSNREMQRPCNDKSEAQQSLPKVHEILCRFVAVVVSSAFRKSLNNLWPPEILSSRKNMAQAQHQPPNHLYFGGLSSIPSFDIPFSNRCGPPLTKRWTNDHQTIPEMNMGGGVSRIDGGRGF